MKKIMLMATMMVATLAASAQYDAGTWSLNVRYGFTGATMINTPDMDLSLAPVQPLTCPAAIWRLLPQEAMWWALSSKNS